MRKIFWDEFQLKKVLSKDSVQLISVTTASYIVWKLSWRIGGEDFYSFYWLYIRKDSGLQDIDFQDWIGWSLIVSCGSCHIRCFSRRQLNWQKIVKIVNSIYNSYCKISLYLYYHLGHTMPLKSIVYVTQIIDWKGNNIAMTFPDDIFLFEFYLTLLIPWNRLPITESSGILEIKRTDKIRLSRRLSERPRNRLEP